MFVFLRLCSISVLCEHQMESLCFDRHHIYTLPSTINTRELLVGIHRAQLIPIKTINTASCKHTSNVRSTLRRQSIQNAELTSRVNGNTHTPHSLKRHRITGMDMASTKYTHAFIARQIAICHVRTECRMPRSAGLV